MNIHMRKYSLPVEYKKKKSIKHYKCSWKLNYDLYDKMLDTDYFNLLSINCFGTLFVGVFLSLAMAQSRGRRSCVPLWAKDLAEGPTEATVAQWVQEWVNS